eukprot:2648311-Rhodomonas_salina.1
MPHTSHASHRVPHPASHRRVPHTVSHRRVSHRVTHAVTHTVPVCARGAQGSWHSAPECSWEIPARDEAR